MQLSDDGVRHTMQNMQFNLTPTESMSLAPFERMLYNEIVQSVYHALSSSCRLSYKSGLCRLEVLNRTPIIAFVNIIKAKVYSTAVWSILP